MKKLFIVSLLTMLTLVSMIACSKKETNTESNSSTPSDKTDTTVLQDKKILAIGDSVMLGASDALKESFPNITVDAKESRQATQATEILENDLAKEDYDTIIIFLGTNGVISENDIQNVIETAKNKDVYWLTVGPGLNWTESVNDIILSAAKDQNKLHIMDWHAEALKNPNWFWDDGLHLKPEGAKGFANFIKENIKQ